MKDAVSPPDVRGEDSRLPIVVNPVPYVKEDGSEMAIGEMIKMETALSLVAMETIRFWQDWVLISSMVEKVVTY